MPAKLTWLGHGSWLIEAAGHNVLLDPFLDESPVAPKKSEQVTADFILVSHGHFDHVADVAPIAHRTKATVVANFEIAEWFSKQKGVDNTLGMNLGGSVQLPFGTVKMTLAHHSSTLPDGTNGGNPAGFLLSVEGKTIYFACDTALFLDMKLIGSAGIDLAVLPIGDLFTMGPEDSLEAIKLLDARAVAPAHYNTWPPIAQDAKSWAERVRAHTRAEPRVVDPGQSIEV
jgi:L-ascorbate metabolism protein UlaG (beta-lactamase superfamily)